MKNHILYLIVVILILLSAAAHFYPTLKIESETQPEQMEANPDSPFWKHESDSLQATISSLKSKNEAIITNLLLQQKRYIQKIQEIKALPADSQLLVFKNYTGCAENISLKVSPGDTIAEIPVKTIRNANLKFVELEASSLQNQMLETKSATQDSLLSTYEHVCADLTRHNVILRDGIRQKEKELKKQKAKHKLELIGAGALIALIIIF